MATSKGQRCIGRISSRIGQAVAPSGFDPEPEIIPADRFLRCFRRVCDWKTDVVQMSYRRGGLYMVDVNFCVVLPLAEYPWTYVDGQSLDNLVRRRRPYYVTTAFDNVRLWRCARVGRRMARDVRASLPWFESLATPGQCLARLGQPDAMSARPGSPVYEAAREHLESLVGSS